MDIEAVEQAAFCLQKVTDNIKELLESKDGIADIMNEHRSFNHHMHPTMQIFKPTTQIYTKLLSKHSMTNMEAVEKIIKEEASFFGDRGTKYHIFLEGNKVVRPNEKYSQNVESFWFYFQVNLPLKLFGMLKRIMRMQSILSKKHFNGKVVVVVPKLSARLEIWHQSMHH